MARSAALAYDYREAQASPSRSTRVRIVPGTRNDQVVSPAVLGLVRIAMVAVVLAAVVACGRVALTAATVNTMISEQDISSQIDVVRNSNATLEVQKSMLSAPSTIKAKAAALGMAEAEATDTIALGADSIALDADGNLSLSLSLERMAA